MELTRIQSRQINRSLIQRDCSYDRRGCRNLIKHHLPVPQAAESATATPLLGNVQAAIPPNTAPSTVRNAEWSSHKPDCCRLSCQPAYEFSAERGLEPHRGSDPDRSINQGGVDAEIAKSMRACFLNLKSALVVSPDRVLFRFMSK